MNTPTHKRWAVALSRLAVDYTWRTLAAVALVTVASAALASRLQLRMNWSDLLPSEHPAVRAYREVQDRFGDPSIVVALEGDRDAIVAMAEELEPRLHTIESLRNVLGKSPTDHLLNHGFLLLKPDRFERALRTFADWSLVGSIRGLNDDYEREYTDSESNLKRDEVDIARSVLGLTRALELLAAGIDSGDRAEALAQRAADAFAIGEPWILALDRRMLLLVCTPTATTDQIEELISTVEQVEATVTDVAANHPAVYASLTGMGKISQDEMHSVGGYTVVLSFAALMLIYLLLARAFRGWIVPLIALAPLLVGIVWTMAVLEILFGALNLFTAMIMLVLLGLGIDFSIHLVSRFQEECANGKPPGEALATTLSGTGTAVAVGALTTAIAFLTLIVGETAGVFEFGVAAGVGVLVTLLAIFFTLPPLLVGRQRRLGHGDRRTAARMQFDRGYAWIGRTAEAGWRFPVVFLSITVVIVLAAIWGARHTAYEYDFLELEAAGLRSVELQRQIPERFGTSDHGAWLVTDSVEHSRVLKEQFRLLPEVGDVNAISDYVPSDQRVRDYAPILENFRRAVLERDIPIWTSTDLRALAVEIDRLWDNLDLMSNLAYTAGLDRIVSVIDQLSGLDPETGESDTSATLPTLTRQLGDITDDSTLRILAGGWYQRQRANLQRMSNPSSVSLQDLPGNIRRSFEPREGGGYLMHIVPRRYLWDRTSLERFASQTEEVHSDVIGSEKLVLLMMDETLEDGRNAALLAIAMIALLLMIHFRGPLGLLALIPLAVGSIVMLGLMYVFGMTYNYMNLIATPIILGIGIDDGVHALHRYRETGRLDSRGVARSFQSVGKAILLTSLTTMIGFGSVGLYEMRGMASFGRVLFMGVGACFLATIFVLPAALRIASGESSRTTISESEKLSHAVD